MLTRHQSEPERGRHHGRTRERRERHERRRARGPPSLRPRALCPCPPCLLSPVSGANAGRDWDSLLTTTTADKLTAMRSTTLYQEVAASPQTRLGQALRTSTLGTPVLVRAYRPTRGMPDVWVVPVLATGSHVVALL